MSVKVGDKYRGSRKGTTVQVTEIKGNLVKFLIAGSSAPIVGRAILQVFTEMYVSKGRIAA